MGRGSVRTRGSAQHDALSIFIRAVTPPFRALAGTVINGYPGSKLRRVGEANTDGGGPQRTDDAEVLGAIMAFWADSDDGNIHTAGDDQERGWRVSSLKSVGNGGHWELDPDGDVPTFDCNAPFDGDADGDCDDSADEPSDGTHAAEKRSGITAAVATAAGAVDYAVDWDGIEPSPRPTRRATRLLHRARQMVETLRC